MAMIRFIVFLFILCYYCVCAFEPFEPHSVPLSAGSSRPWFEGWYTRISVENANDIRLKSFGLILGSFPGDRIPPSGSGGKNLVSLLIQMENQELKTVDRYVQTLTAEKCSNSKESASPCFSVSVNDPQVSGYWNVTASSQVMDFQWIHDSKVYALHAELTNPVFWDENGYGPEGKLAGSLPFPLHWYVYSVASHTLFTLQMPDTQPIIGEGLAHQEKNWGRAFPSVWLWAQHSTKTHQMVFAGGDLGINPSLPHVFLLKYNSPSVNLTWTPYDRLLHPLQVSIDACAYTLSVKGKKNGYSLSMKMSASKRTFSSVQCPTTTGFHPYSIESFQSELIITIHRQDLLIEEYRVNSTHIVSSQTGMTVTGSAAALEFGGQWVCPPITHSTDPTEPSFLIQKF